MFKGQFVVLLKIESGINPKIVNSNIQKHFSKKYLITGFVMITLKTSEIIVENQQL